MHISAKIEVNMQIQTYYLLVQNADGKDCTGCGREVLNCLNSELKQNMWDINTITLLVNPHKWGSPNWTILWLWASTWNLHSSGKLCIQLLHSLQKCQPRRLAMFSCWTIFASEPDANSVSWAHYHQILHISTDHAVIFYDPGIGI